MKIGGEEVELVTDFAQLRAVMIVWSMPCRFCGDKHRYFLLSFAVSTGAEPNGTCLPSEPRWLVLPLPPCETLLSRGVTRATVARRQIFRVVDPLLDAKTTTRARELTRG